LEMLRRGESGEKVERDTSLAGYVEVELHSTSPAAVSAVRAAMVALPGINTEPFIDKAGRYYVPAGFAADAAVRQGYVAGTVAATEDEAEDAAPGYKPLPIRGFETTAASKPPLIENLALSLERAEVRWLDVPVATAELEAYERKSSAATGRASYSAPAGVHDDTVIARALARKEAGRLGTMATTRLWA